MGVTAQGRGGEETHKRLDVTGPAYASHHGDLNREFLYARGGERRRVVRAEREVQAEKWRAKEAERKQDGEAAKARF